VLVDIHDNTVLGTLVARIGGDSALPILRHHRPDGPVSLTTREAQQGADLGSYGDGSLPGVGWGLGEELCQCWPGAGLL
jgi:hypothetical protein